MAVDDHWPVHRQPSRQAREARIRLGEPLALRTPCRASTL